MAIKADSKSLAKAVSQANEQLAQANQRVAVLSEDNESLRAEVQLIIATAPPIQT
jgi:cell division protein FtsB